MATNGKPAEPRVIHPDGKQMETLKRFHNKFKGFCSQPGSIGISSVANRS
jgi:hypothetical protein